VFRITTRENSSAVSMVAHFLVLRVQINAKHTTANRMPAAARME